MKPKNILVTGSFSVGKSSVTEKLEQKIPQEQRMVTYDQARWYMRERNLNANTMSEQQKHEMQLFVIAAYMGAIIHSSRTHIMGVLDGSLIEARAYSEGIVNQDILDSIDKRLQDYKNHSIAYVIPPTIPLENDGLRHNDKEFRIAIHEKVMHIIEKFQIPHKFILSEGPARRAKEILTLHNNQ